MTLNNRVAIVTGAGGGLGRAHAHYLASQGAAIVVNDRDGTAAGRVTAEIQAMGGQAIAAPASVVSEDEVAAMVKVAIAKWGTVDILINNAGILRDKSFAKMTMDDFRLVVDVHLIGAAICSKAVWDHMRERNYGRIVMTTSSSGLFGNFGQANYGAAKMALVGLMQTLAIEGEKYNIRVNSLAPTAATQMTEGVLSDDALSRLSPDAVSPGLLALVGEDAPTRAILCAGGGHFASSHITLTDGIFIGRDVDTGQKLRESWSAVTRRDGEIVPQYGFTQAERELASGGYAQEVVAVTHT